MKCLCSQLGSLVEKRQSPKLTKVSLSEANAASLVEFQDELRSVCKVSNKNATVLLSCTRTRTACRTMPPVPRTGLAKGLAVV